MLNIDATDNLEAIASVTNVIDFTCSIVDGTTVGSSEGKVTDANTTIWTATAVTRVLSLTFVNTHSAAVTLTLNKDPGNVGTLYKLFSISLGIGYSLVFDGARFAVFDASGVLMQGMGVSNTAYAASWDGVINVAPSQNAVYDQMLLQMLKTGSNLAIGSDADGDMYFRASSVLARLAKGAADTKMFMNAGATAPEWAAGIKTGTITRAMDAATGAVPYTGIGFKPSLLFLMAANPLSTSWSIGFSLTGSTSFNMRGWGATFAPESGATLMLLLAEDAAQTKYQHATITSFDADGFTLAWTRTGVTAAGTATIGYIAFR